MKRQLVDAEKDKKLLLSYLIRVNDSFGVPLTQKVQLPDYISKLLRLGCVLVMIEGDEILSCVAFYCNDMENRIAYCVLVSTVPQAQGKGYARLLINEMIKICKSKSFVSIETSSINPIAIALYIYFTILVNNSLDALSYNELFIKSYHDYYNYWMSRRLMLQMHGNSWKNDFNGVLLA